VDKKEREYYEKFRVKGSPELIADLEDLARQGVGSRELTEYAVVQGVELPEHFNTSQYIGRAYSGENGEEIYMGLFWDDPASDRESEIPS
jgi:hypothetical protein